MESGELNCDLLTNLFRTYFCCVTVSFRWVKVRIRVRFKFKVRSNVNVNVKVQVEVRAGVRFRV